MSSFNDVIDITFDFIKSDATTITDTSLFNFANAVGIGLSADDIKTIISDKFGSGATSFTKTQFMSIINSYIDSKGIPSDPMISITFSTASDGKDNLEDETKFDAYYNHTNPGQLNNIKNKMVQLSGVSQFSEITEAKFKDIIDQLLNI